MNDLVRDTDTKKIISYTDENIQENTGYIEVPVIDDRFLSSDFNYVVKTKFSSLPEAVSAETNMISQVNEYEKLILTGVPIGGLTDSNLQTIKNVAKNELLSNLSNLVLGNPDSNAALKERIKELEDALSLKDGLIDNLNRQQDVFDTTIDAWGAQNLANLQRIDALERVNLELQRQQQFTLDTVKQNVDDSVTQTSASLATLINNNEDAFTILTEETKLLRDIAKLPDLTKLLSDSEKNG
jgi:hypothetical protein